MIKIEKLKKIKDVELAEEMQKLSSTDVYNIDFHWWVAYKNKKWVGFAGLRLITDEISYVGPTFVKPEARGQGLQLRFFRIRERFTKKNNRTKMVCRVDYDNPWSANNCIRAGFHLEKQPLVGKMEDGSDIMSIDKKVMIYLVYPELYFVKDL